jgi:cytidylate kinase
MSEKKYVITIAREYGSGGRLIGQKLAEMLNISFYDKEIISLAAEESGLSEEFMRQHDQKKKPLSFVHNIYVSNKSLPLSEQIFQAQCQVIREVAEKSSCVIVGRCADHVLTDNPNCIKVFIQASEAEKIQRIRHDYQETCESPAAYAAKIDKERAAHYNYFTLEKWGNRQNYHLVLNSTIGIEACALLIKQYVESFLAQQHPIE